MGKPNPEEVKYVDHSPTEITLEGGKKFNPDREKRFSIAHMKNGERRYLYDGKDVPLQDFFGATVGRESIPKRITVFGGIGEGLMRKAWETEADYTERMRKLKEN